MWKIALLSFMGADAAASFPGGASDALASIANVIQGATSSASYKGKKSGDAAAIANAVSSGTKKLSEAVASEMNLAALRSDAFVLTHLQLRKQLHVGGCSRDYSIGCPVGFVDNGSTCSPSSDYTGPCGSRNLKSFSTSQKEDFAFKCGVSWPCSGMQSPSYAGCPTGWQSGEGGVCMAPSSYGGICSPTTNFGSFSETEKAQWSAFCGVNW